MGVTQQTQHRIGKLGKQPSLILPTDQGLLVGIYLIQCKVEPNPRAEYLRFRDQAADLLVLLG